MRIDKLCRGSENLRQLDNARGLEIDYAMLNKVYRSNPEGQTRYSQAKYIVTSQAVISGDPDPKHVSTSDVERQNLTMRMSMRRFTRLTNAFLKKLENHAAMVALYFMYYNFARASDDPGNASDGSGHLGSCPAD
jgi:hypothetical protein